MLLRRPIDPARRALLARRAFLSESAALAVLAAGRSAGAAEIGSHAVRPEDFGARGGDDDTAAIQRMASEAPKLGLRIDGGGKSYNVDNVVWPSGTRLANIRLVLTPGNRDDRSPIAIGKRGVMTRDLEFENVVVDGNRARQEAVGRSGYADGARSGFQIRGAVERVVLRNCAAVNCATDGVMIFSDLQHRADDSYPLRDISLSRVTMAGNRRHGVSADGFRGLRMSSCLLTGNGSDLEEGAVPDHGRSGARHNGALYGRPFDIEDYLVGTGWTDLMIKECDCRANVIGGLIYSQVTPDSPGFIPRSNALVYRSLFDDPRGSRWDPPLGVAQVIGYQGSLPTFRNVRLIDNIVENGPLRLSGIDGLVIRGGRISVTKHNETDPVLLSNCRNVSLSV